MPPAVDLLDTIDLQKMIWAAYDGLGWGLRGGTQRVPAPPAPPFPVSFLKDYTTGRLLHLAESP
jgi:hypothetical protein